MNTQDEIFEYTYAAPTEAERRTIEHIRKSYLSQTKAEDDFSRLQRLDRKVQNPPMVFALSFGIVGTLVFGTGLTFALELGKLISGALIAAAGIIPIVAAYPNYRLVLKRQKKKYAEKIIELSDKLLKNDEN